jgi:hypothetical protein
VNGNGVVCESEKLEDASAYIERHKIADKFK